MGDRYQVIARQVCRGPLRQGTTAGYTIVNVRTNEFQTLERVRFGIGFLNGDSYFVRGPNGEENEVTFRRDPNDLELIPVTDPDGVVANNLSSLPTTLVDCP